MTRLESVIKALTAGFGDKVVTVQSINGSVHLTVDDIEGHFEINEVGDITAMPVGISGEVAYWIGLDLQCLDLLALDAIDPE